MATPNTRPWLRGAVALGALVMSMGAAGIEGRYAGQFNGQPAEAHLSTSHGVVQGSLDIGGYVYRIQVRAQGDGLAGQMHDQQGVAVPISLHPDGERLLVRAWAQGPQAPPVELTLSPGAPAEQEARAASTDAAIELDPVLVGHWVRSDSYTSGDFGMVSQTSVTLFPDGTYRYGPGRVIGGGDAGTFDSGGGGGEGAGGRWRTESRILHTMEAGSGWVPYARYYVEGATLMLTFGNGARELWSRR